METLIENKKVLLLLGLFHHLLFHLSRGSDRGSKVRPMSLLTVPLSIPEIPKDLKSRYTPVVYTTQVTYVYVLVYDKGNPCEVWGETGVGMTSQLTQ